MNEWVQFSLTAAVLVAALAFFTAGAVGNIRFGVAVNRIHAAGIGDSMGLFFTTLALAVSGYGPGLSARLFLPLVFLWITSPVSSHFLALMEIPGGNSRAKAEGGLNQWK